MAAPIKYVSGRCTVYTRANWADEWTVQPNLWCEECSWVTDGIPTATLSYKYGRVKRPDASMWTQYTKLSIKRVWVKVAWQCERVGGEFTTRNWYGLVDLEQDQMGGAQVTAGASKAVGVQLWTAYGLARLLQQEPIRQAFWADGQSHRAVDVLPDFNARGKPNRTKNKVGGVHLFEPNESNAEHWTTRDIVDYISFKLTPRDSTGANALSFTFDDTTITPDWDQPTVSQRNTTAFDLLNRLISRRRMTTWWLDVTEGEADTIDIYLESMAGSAITLSSIVKDASDFPANANKTAINYDSDPLVHTTVRDSNVELFDQVIVRGAEQISVCTVGRDDSTLYPGWDTSLGTEYEEARSGAEGYDDWTLADKRRKNAEFRSRERFKDAFAYFYISQTWDRKVKDRKKDSDNKPVFLTDTNGTYPAFYPEMVIQPELPLLRGVDYSGDKIKQDKVDATKATDGTNLPPIAIFRHPDTAEEEAEDQRWIPAEKIGELADEAKTDDAQNFLWSGSLVVPHHSHGVRIEVSGQPQHAIDGKNFTGVDADPDLGEWDTQNGFLLTVALNATRYCEGKWPASVAAGLDCVKRKILYAGDGHQQIYVAPGTVVGVADDGQRQFSSGGYLRDDSKQLEAAAKVLASYYGTSHKIVTIESARLLAPDTLDIGDMITTIGNAKFAGQGHHRTVNSVVTSIAISAPSGNNDSGGTSAPTMTIETWAGEMELML